MYNVERIVKEKDFSWLRKTIKDREIRFENKIKSNPICIDLIEGVKHIRLCSYGNLSLIMGDQKTRKTFFLIMLIAAAVKGTIHNLSGRNEGKGVVLVDTEQAEHDVYKTLSRIVRLCGMDKQPDNLKVISISALDANEQMDVIEQYLEDNKNVGFLGIDGLLDLVDDFNDIRESKECFLRMKTWLKKYDIHISVIMHIGLFNERTALGHIGKFIQRKAESVIEIKIPEYNDDISEIKARFMRGTQKFKPFILGIDEDGLPYIDTGLRNDGAPF